MCIYTGIQLAKKQTAESQLGTGTTQPKDKFQTVMPPTKIFLNTIYYTKNSDQTKHMC